MVNLTHKQMEAICILADEKPHFFSDMVASLKMKESNFISDVLKPLQRNGFCIYGDPKKNAQSRPPAPPYYDKVIHNNQSAFSRKSSPRS